MTDNVDEEAPRIPTPEDIAQAEQFKNKANELFGGMLYL